jgi:uncharacterized protein (TIGR03435 family)
MKDFEQRVLERMPSPEEERASLGRVWNQLERAGGRIPDEVLRSVQREVPEVPRVPKVPGVRGWKTAAAAALVIVAVGGAMFWPRGVRLYAAGNDGLQVTLEDDSRVEMRAHSEMAVDRGSDGIQINLKTGDIIVTAAKRRDGHLSVRTKDMTVAVEGTVFLANAGQQGSRVAVIEGEVRVRQRGAPLPISVEKRLRPGEQLTTSASIAQRPLAEDIKWSRNKDAHLAILDSFLQGVAQTTAPLTRLAPQAGAAAAQSPGASQPPDAQSSAPEFEEASIRRCDPDNVPPPPAGARGGGTQSFYMTPGRTYGLCITLATLIRTAYGGDEFLDKPSALAPDKPARGLQAGLVYRLAEENGRGVRGGPDWVRSEPYTIEAVAAGPADAATMRGPMLRALLARRFGLKVHIETEQIPAFDLTVAAGGHKMKEGTCTVRTPPAGVQPVIPAGAGREGRGREAGPQNGWRVALEAIRRGDPAGVCGLGFSGLGKLINGSNVVMVAVGFNVPPLGQIVDSEIVNRTGIPAGARFNYILEYAPDDSLGHLGQINPPGGGPLQIASDPAAVPPAPRFFTALEQQLGLKLTASRAPHEFVVIDAVERPGPN